MYSRLTASGRYVRAYSPLSRTRMLSSVLASYSLMVTRSNPGAFLRTWSQNHPFSESPPNKCISEMTRHLRPLPARRHTDATCPLNPAPAPSPGVLPLPSHRTLLSPLAPPASSALNATTNISHAPHVVGTALSLAARPSPLTLAEHHRPPQLRPSPTHNSPPSQPPSGSRPLDNPVTTNLPAASPTPSATRTTTLSGLNPFTRVVARYLAPSGFTASDRRGCAEFAIEVVATPFFKSDSH
jgi:hypothetical protein